MTLENKSFSFHFDREYYGPAARNHLINPEVTFYEGEQRNKITNFALVSRGIVATAIAYSVFGLRNTSAPNSVAKALGHKDGMKMKELIYSSVRAAENYSPGKILNTLQLGNYMSMATDTALTYTPEMIEKNKPLRDYLVNLVGTDKYMQLASEGLSVSGGQAVFPQSGEVALERAYISMTEEGAKNNVVSAFARQAGAGRYFDKEGVAKAGEFFAKEFPVAGSKVIRNPTIGGHVATIVGAKTEKGWIAAHIGAFGTESITRLNRLVEMPFEMQPIKGAWEATEKVVQKVTGEGISLAVKERSVVEMTAGLAGKFGLLFGAIGLGYAVLDKATEKAPFLNNTVWDEGLGAGAGTLAANAHISAAKASEAIGLSDLRDWQEDAASGSTNLTRLLAFTALAGIGANAFDYGQKAKLMYKYQRATKAAPHIAEKVISERIAEGSQKETLSHMARPLVQAGESFGEGKFGKFIEKIATKDAEGNLVYKVAGKMTPQKALTLGSVGIGLALVSPFLLGAIAPEKSSEELEAEYSGEKEVAVRHGRWWSLGRTPWEGGRIDYYRPGWLSRMRQGAKEVSIWGDKGGIFSPVTRWLKSEFTYDLEKMHYHDRPYPVSALPFEDVPLVGPLLSKTIGRAIKPEVYMHTEEWMGGGSIDIPGEEQAIASSSVLAPYPRYGTINGGRLGQEPRGVPISPHGMEHLIGESVYRGTEAAGLTGFLATAVKGEITGREDTFDQQMQLQSSREMAGFERDYWEMNLGGLMGGTELWRRFFPHKRRQIEEYNPIRNTMPGWLPGANDKGKDFLVGNPYSTVPEGEMRLPGAGYAARFPELEGVAPKDYPLIHQYKILGDVAPSSFKFKEAKQLINAKRNSENWTEDEEAIYQTVGEQRREKQDSGRQFHEYKMLQDTSEHWGNDAGMSLLTELNKQYASQKEEEKGGIFKRAFGSYWEVLSHHAESPFEQLTPVSPAAKFIHMRSSIEDYEKTQVYGRENSYWQKPFSDFIRPAAYSYAHGAGYEGIPDYVQHKRDINEMFDVLKYTKATRLSNIARSNKDYGAVALFERQKRETLAGVDPYTKDVSALYRALPSEDRDYFQAFTEAASDEERSKILNLVPDNEKKIYQARWKMQMVEEASEHYSDLSSGAKAELRDVEAGIADESAHGGFEHNPVLEAEYKATKSDRESYQDWYMRSRVLPEYNIPGPDWVGFNPAVDLDDVKLKAVQMMGEDIHEYGLWPRQENELLYKPYINESVVMEIAEPHPSIFQHQRMRRILASLNTNGEVVSSPKNSDTIVIKEQEDKRSLLESLL